MFAGVEGKLKLSFGAIQIGLDSIMVLKLSYGEPPKVESLQSCAWTPTSEILLRRD